MSTMFDDAYFSELVYRQDADHRSLVVRDNTYTAPSGAVWRVLSTSEDNSVAQYGANGFFGALLRNDQTGELMFALRGTEKLSGDDWWTNKIDALAKGLDSARQLVKANDLAVRKGERVMLDVLISERSVAQIERDLAQARYAYLIGRMTLHQLAGHLVVEDLQELALFFRSERRSSK